MSEQIYSKNISMCDQIVIYRDRKGNPMWEEEWKHGKCIRITNLKDKE
jgi:hypothetical protein